MIVEDFYQSLMDSNGTLVNSVAGGNFIQIEFDEALRLFMSHPKNKEILLRDDSRHVYAKTCVQVRLQICNLFIYHNKKNNNPFIHARINKIYKYQSFGKIKIINNIKRDGAETASKN
jgi:hypothetical protein